MSLGMGPSPGMPGINTPVNVNVGLSCVGANNCNLSGNTNVEGSQNLTG